MKLPTFSMDGFAIQRIELRLQHVPDWGGLELRAVLFNERNADTGEVEAQEMVGLVASPRAPELSPRTVQPPGEENVGSR